MTTLEPSRSPCRSHPCSVEHADVVRGFRESARLWLEQAEATTGGYSTEMARYAEEQPRPTFREYLIKLGRYAREQAQ